MLVKKELGIDVLTAAKQRIIEIFKYPNRIELSFSGGKDSIVLSDILYNLCVQGKIDKSKLSVSFFDEEAMYDDVVDIVKLWRSKWMDIGVKFTWYCIPIKHFNCLNTMNDEETFICWDERKKDVWCRQKPKFAVSDNEYLIPTKDNYQTWDARRRSCLNIISIQGVRASESIQRLKNIANIKNAVANSSGSMFPIYDMTDKDVWLYIKKYGCEIPKAYENLYRVGTAKNKLRISQFFSIDTARSLVSLSEMYPDLMERVTKREPNAYLCAMYWDTEMFGKSTSNRRKLEENQEQKDYKSLCFEKIRNIDKEESESKRKVINKVKHIICKAPNMNDKLYKEAYELIVTGDPKSRKYRAFVSTIFDNYSKQSKENEKCQN